MLNFALRTGYDNLDKSVMIITSYDGPYGGNFIASLIYYNKQIRREGLRTIYVFQEKVKSFSWIKNILISADKVYFLPYKPNSLGNILAIRSIVNDENVRVIYSRMGGWDIAAHLAAPKIQIIWHMEMSPNLSSLSKRIKYFGKYRILGGKNVHPIAVSFPGSDALNSLHPKNACIPIPNATDFSRLADEPKPFERKNKTTSLLIFGYNPFVKGLDIAIDACEKLNMNDYRYELIVSAQEQTYEYIKRRFGDIVPTWITLVPPLDNVSQLYEKADIMLSPSRYEGFSYCLLEAIYSGLPAVYSDISGTNWVDEMNGVYQFKSENVEDLICAINKCVNRGISEKEQNLNRSIIYKKYSLDSWGKKMVTLTCEMISKS